MSIDKQVVEKFIKGKLSEFAELPEETIFADGTTLADVLASSPRMTNSIDLMESFARTSNAVNAEFGLRVRLPGLPLDTPTTEALTAFLEEFDRQQQKQQEALA